MEDLLAENEKLKNDINSMKKKIILAMRKQQADLQSKVQVAEKSMEEAGKRASAAESALQAAKQENEENLKDLQHEIETLRINLQNAKMEETEAIANGNKELQQKLEETMKRLSESQAALEMGRKNFAEAEKVKADLERQLQAAALQVSNSAERAAAADEEKQKLYSRVVELEKEKEAMVSSINLTSKTLEEIETANTELVQLFKISTAAEKKALQSLDEQEQSEQQTRTLHEVTVRELRARDAELEESEKKRSSLSATCEDLAQKLREADVVAVQKAEGEESVEVVKREVEVAGKEVREGGEGEEALPVKAELVEALEEHSELSKGRIEALDGHLEGVRSGGSGLGDREVEQSATEDGGVKLGEGSEQSEGVRSLEQQIEALQVRSAQDSSASQSLQGELHKAGEEIGALKAQIVLLEERNALHTEQSLAEQKAEEESQLLVNSLLEKVKTLQAQLADAESRAEEGLRQREEKCAELDANLKRLQKRAKQRIQEITKEKEEAEAMAVSAGEKVAQALSRQAALQEELDRVCQDSAQALKAAEADKGRLRAEKASLAEEVEELRRALEAKEITLGESRRLAAAKEQAWLEVSSAAQEEKEEQEAAMAEVKQLLEKRTEEFEAELEEVREELEKAEDSVSRLKAELSEQERSMADLEASSQEEVARLSVLLDTARNDMTLSAESHAEQQQRAEQRLEELQARVEAVEKSRRQGEAAAAEKRGALEGELEELREEVKRKEEAARAAEEQAERVGGELAAYKTRAAALLQKKNAELEAVKEGERTAEYESKLEEAREAVERAYAERDTACRALDLSALQHNREMADQRDLLLQCEQRVQEMMQRQEGVRIQVEAEQAEWQARLQEVEAYWKGKCQSLEDRVAQSMDARLAEELDQLRKEHQALKTESSSWQNMTGRMLEEKESEIARLLDETARLQGQVAMLEQQQQQIQDREEGYTSPMLKAVDVDPAAAVAAAEQQILLLARQQAQREEEVLQSRRHIQALQEEISELEKESRLRSQQEALLKEEVRSMQRAQTRETVDMTYLKNVVFKMLHTGEVVALLPVIAMLLQFSPEEVKKCHDMYHSSHKDSFASDSSAPLSLFQVFSFGAGKG